MTNETNVPRPNLDLILSTIPLAIQALDKESTSYVVATAAAMAVHDAAIATFGSAMCLTATSRNKTASVEEKDAYAILRNAAVTEVWGKAFTDKVNNGKDAKETIGAPKKGMASNTRFYWQQQMGKVFGRITDRIAKVVSQAASADSTKAPNRKAPIDVRVIGAMGAPMKAVRTALEAKTGKGEPIPPHVEAHAYLRLCELALLALSPTKEKRDLARLCLAAYDAALAVDVKASKPKRITHPLASSLVKETPADAALAADVAAIKTAILPKRGMARLYLAIKAATTLTK
jgi:hypothetical protein